MYLALQAATIYLQKSCTNKQLVHKLLFISILFVYAQMCTRINNLSEVQKLLKQALDGLEVAVDLTMVTQITNMFCLPIQRQISVQSGEYHLECLRCLEHYQCMFMCLSHQPPAREILCGQEHLKQY